MKDKLSTRLRTYIRVPGIGTTNNAKVGWGTMTAQCENTGASAERLTAVVFTISTFVGALGRIAEMTDLKDKANSYDDALCELGEVVELQTAIRDLGHHLLDCHDAYIAHE
jgi:hypothetical protein